MISIKNLCFSYNKNVIFENFNFQSNENIISFTGPSGCGKTTLLKILSNNIDNYSCDEMEISSSPFLILQEDSLFPWLTGLENIKYFINGRKDIMEIPMFDRAETFINKKAYQMSFGQRRIIEILRALVFDPNVLLLDEPFNYIDERSREIVSEALLNFSKLEKKKIILTSHYTEDLINLNPKNFKFNGLFPVSMLI